MDVDRIRSAFRGRFDELSRRDPSLTYQRIADRMGATTRTVANLVNDQPKKGFHRGTLRAASRALEWPEDALELIESGDVDAEDLPEVEWHDEGELRLIRIEDEQGRLAEDLQAIREDMAAIRELLSDQREQADGPR